MLMQFSFMKGLDNRKTIKMKPENRKIQTLGGGKMTLSFLSLALMVDFNIYRFCNLLIS